MAKEALLNLAREPVAAAVGSIPRWRRSAAALPGMRVSSTDEVAAASSLATPKQSA